jgi:EmrB/QacA subfamily drug resistance transporter
LVIGIVLFAAASLLCAAAPGLGWLLAGRALLGVGAALLMPNSLAILGASFSGPARGRAIGIWAAAGAGAGAIGPLLGGWLIDVVGWRAIFMINLPIAAAALVLAVVAIRAEKEASPPALDLAGAALASAGLGALTWGLTVASAASAGLADRGARDLGCAVALGTGTLLVLFFLGVERRRGDDAMLPLALFSSRSFVGLNLLTFLLYGALGALLVLVPYVLIQAQGYSATAAGAALLPLALVIAVASPTLGRIAATVGARGPLTIGPAIVAGGCLLALRIDAAATYWTSTFPALLVVALGMAGAVAPLTTAVLAAVEARHNGVAAGFNSAVARTGGLIATALLGSILGTRGAALEAWFRLAALAGAGASLAAAACAFVWLKPK